MLRTFAGELFKLRRRPAIWVTVALLLVFAVGLGYAVIYLVATHPPANAVRQGRGAELAVLRLRLYPSSFLKYTLNQWVALGGIFALILGVLAQGSEYGWETVKTMYTQLPGRLSMLSGKLAALAVFLILMVLLLFGFTAGASLVIANLDGKAVNFPAVTDIARGMGAALLIFGFWALLGFTLATLFRQSAMAIGLGLAYGLVLEGLVFGLLGALGSDVIKTIHTWLPIANASSLSASFGQVPGGGPGPTQSTPLTDANHAVLVLCLYVAWLVGLTSVLVRQRDIV